MKKTITSIVLAAAIALSTSTVFAQGVDPQITDAITIGNTKEINNNPSLIMKLEKIASMPMMKIGNSDVPDNMLSLLSALRAGTAYVGLMSKEASDPRISVRLEAQSLLQWIKANPKERNLLDNIEYLNLQGALDAVINNI